MLRYPAALFLAMLILPVAMPAQVPFAVSPSWSSADGGYGTGGALVDINNDGWLDLVVAKGNDMARERLVVYFNEAGTLSRTPGWSSADVDYHGHLAAGDVNNDGWPDVAVSVYLGAAGFSERGRVKVYMNINGILESTPSWVSADPAYTFSCAFGDPDGDGDLDLAVACGESYYNRAERQRLYRNVGGKLDSLPSWMSASASFAYDVAWIDVEGDGRLDLAFAGERGPNMIFRNDGDSLRVTPTWSSADDSRYANSLFVGDVDRDGHRDIAVSDNNQLGGTGHFKIYMNRSGVMDTLPSWSSEWSGLGSAITLADLDADSDPDLITGGWWQPCRIYVNSGGQFPATPGWTSSVSPVAEVIVVGDVNGDGLDTVHAEYGGDGARSFFYFPWAPVQAMVTVSVGPDMLARDAYCLDGENGWISLAVPPPAGDTLRVAAVVSRRRDFAVTDWEGTTVLFVNTGTSTEISHGNEAPEGFRLEQNYPNPFNAETRIKFRTAESGWVKLAAFDLLGRQVLSIVEGHLEAGWHTAPCNARGLASGTYVVRLLQGEFSSSRVMTIVK